MGYIVLLMMRKAISVFICVFHIILCACQHRGSNHAFTPVFKVKELSGQQHTFCHHTEQLPPQMVQSRYGAAAVSRPSYVLYSDGASSWFLIEETLQIYAANRCAAQIIIQKQVENSEEKIIELYFQLGVD
jgi:hypothetical protein